MSALDILLRRVLCQPDYLVILINTDESGAVEREEGREAGAVMGHLHEWKDREETFFFYILITHAEEGATECDWDRSGFGYFPDGGFSLER